MDHAAAAAAFEKRGGARGGDGSGYGRRVTCSFVKPSGMYSIVSAPVERATDERSGVAGPNAAAVVATRARTIAENFMVMLTDLKACCVGVGERCSRASGRRRALRAGAPRRSHLVDSVDRSAWLRQQVLAFVTLFSELILRV